MIYKSKFKKNILIEKKLQEWIENIIANDDLKEELEIMYEWEYKYSAIKDRASIANEKKVNNILKNIRIRLKPILDSITHKLEEVFTDWLSKHAFTSARTWATARINESLDFDSYSDISYSDIIYNGRFEYERYKGNRKDYYNKVFIASFDEIKDIIYDIKEEYLDQENSELENTDDEEEKEDIRNRIESVENFDITGDPQDALYFVENYLGEDAEEFVKRNATEEVCLLAYEKVVFPVWFKHWKEKGIVKTRKRVEQTYKDLKKSKKESDIQKRIMYINMALNESHQTGSMMDYVEIIWNVGEEDLDELSNVDDATLEAWNKEVGMFI